MQNTQTDNASKLAMAKDFLAVQTALKPIVKDSKNPFLKNSYASLNAHLEVILPILNQNNFTLEQPTTVVQGKNLVITRLVHVPTGEVKESALALPDTDDMQKLGGAISYQRRYQLGSMLSLTAEDDDGNTAVGRQAVKKKASKLY